MRQSTFTKDRYGFSAVLCEPDTHTGRAVILVLGGGTGARMGQLFAENFVRAEIAAMTVSLFGAEGLPDSPDRLEAAMIERAAQYLKNVRGYVHLSIWGQSMGSLFALIAAEKTQAFEKIILVSPAHVPFEGTGKDRRTLTHHSCVMWKGEELPFVSADFSEYSPGRIYRPGFLKYPVSGMWLSFQKAYQDTEKEKAALLHPEKTGAAILMIAGEMDESWPAAYSVRKLEKQMKDAGYDRPYRTILNPHGSHLCGMKPDRKKHPWLYRLIPLIGLAYRTFGKYPQENIQYMEQAEKEILSWIKGE